MMRLAGLVAALLLAPITVLAQETRIADEGAAPTPATLGQLDWLIGQWSGTGIAGAPAYESWLPPTGGTMVGTFVQTTGSDPAGRSITFTEHMYITEDAGSLVLKLKHFNPDLTGWEARDDMLTFPLVAIEDCAAFFQALTLRCEDADNPGGGLVAAVRMKSDDAEPKELIFRFEPMVRAQHGGSYGCDGTTFAVNECLSEVRNRAEDREQHYFDAAIINGPGLPARMTELEGSMRAAHTAAKTYRKEACSAVYEQWKEGTIRDAMYLRCEIRLIDQRTHTIWHNWLTFQDSTDPVLPEPGPSQ